MVSKLSNYNEKEYVIMLFQLKYFPGALLVSCEASCRSLMEEARHVATMGFLDISMVKGIGPYANPNPGSAKHSDGNFTTKGGRT